MSEGKSTRAKNPRAAETRSGGRKFAEWVSLGCSAVIIASLAAYLLFEALQPHPSHVPVGVQPVFKEARAEGGRFILPVRVANQGRRTVRDLVIELTQTGGGADNPTSELTIGYLGERSEQTVYFYLDRTPEENEVQARARSYQLD